MRRGDLSSALLGACGDLSGWWPGEELFEIAVSAILVQGVAWRNVLIAMERLRSLGLLAPRELAAADRAMLEDCLRPALYYHQKAGYLQDFAAWVAGDLAGDIASLGALGAKEALRRLGARRGIGPETASAIGVYALNMAVAVVDRYAVRLFLRTGVLLPAKASFAAARRELDGMIAGSPQRARDLHAAIVEVSRLHCRRVPACETCPLAERCPRQLGDTAPKGVRI